jgi:hypothetical protein
VFCWVFDETNSHRTKWGGGSLLYSVWRRDILHVVDPDRRAVEPETLKRRRPEMTEFVATTIFGVILSLGALTWLIAVRYTRRLGKSPSQLDWTAEVNTQPGLNTGELLCDASKDDLMERLPKIFRRQSLSILASVFKLEERNDAELSFQRIGPLICNLPIALYFSRVRFRFEPQSANTTLVKYTIDQTDVLSLLNRIASRLLFFVAFPIMVGIGLLMCYVVIPSHDLAIRAQVIQTIHIFHVIWPAFMFIGIAVAAKRATKQFIERVLMVACDPELMFLADDLLPRGKPPVRTAGSALQSM